MTISFHAVAQLWDTPLGYFILAQAPLTLYHGSNACDERKQGEVTVFIQAHNDRHSSRTAPSHMDASEEHVHMQTLNPGDSIRARMNCSFDLLSLIV